MDERESKLELSRLTVKKGGRSVTIKCSGTKPLTLGIDEMVGVAKDADSVVIGLRDDSGQVINFKVYKK